MKVNSSIFSLFNILLLKQEICTHNFKMYRIKYTSLNTPNKTHTKLSTKLSANLEAENQKERMLYGLSPISLAKIQQDNSSYLQAFAISLGQKL